MSPLEIAASIFTLVSVWLSVRRNIWLYPWCIVGTALYFWVFAQARLYSSAGLQVFFTVIQFYGWWYWLRGVKGGPPELTRLGAPLTLLATLATIAASLAAGWQIGRMTNAASAMADASITGLSILAQFLLDRKKFENWYVWALVDALSVATYYGQGLLLTAALYAVLLGLVVLGWFEWRKAMAG